MDDREQLLVDLAVLSIILAGIWRFRNPKAARSGNLMVAVALFCTLGIEVFRSPLHAPVIAMVAFAIGSLGGLTVARRVNMTQIPALVGFQNGAGGLASCLVSFVGLTREPLVLSSVEVTAALFGLIVGAATFSGSMVASGKLANLLRQTPVAIRGHGRMLLAGAAMIAVLALGVATAAGPIRAGLAAAVVLLSLLFGIPLSMKVGGADMPVLISLLNALSGLSAGFCGVVVQSQVLTACGAAVAASGLVLTYAMCRAMNRSLVAVLLGTTLDYARHHAGARKAEGEPDLTAAKPAGPTDDPFSRATEVIRTAGKVIIIPGYGMALAHAQTCTVQLANRLRETGKDVRFAVHPLAGRMPGHMHVLLAEAEVDPDMLFDLNEVNPEFPAADLALVVGACDVVNPAAASVDGTPISGMPILAAHEAKSVLVCNLDAQPGYSGVDNPLYKDPKTILLLGDADQTLSRLLGSLH